MIDLKNNIKILNGSLERISLKNIVDLQQKSEDLMFSLENIDNSLVKKYLKKTGIYYFEVKFNEDLDKNNMYEYLSKEWELGHRKNIPKIIKKRVEEHSNLIVKNEWYPFYIGKSDDIGSRLHEHLEGRSTTASLRLNEIKTGLFKEAVYRVKVLDLSCLSGEYYWTVAKIETNMRENLNPICGR